MARLYPPEIAASTKSSAERRLFEIIGSQLGNDWCVLHSLGLAEHQSKVWGEIDFVLVGTTGIYCLEVKGGHVAREDGVWYYTDRYGTRHRSYEGPFEQAQSAAHSLRRYLLGRIPWVNEAAVGWGVAMPDVPFRFDGPDLEPRVLYDVRDTVRPFAEYVDRLSDYWHRALGSAKRRPVSALGHGQIRAVVDTLRGDFDLRPSLSDRVRAASDELLRLTEEQYRVLDGLSLNPRVLVRGSAGTGKTLLAVEEARRLAREGRRVLFVCYNRNLSRVLKATVADLDGVEVFSLHGLMHRLISEAGLAGRLPQAQLEDLFEVFYPSVAFDAIVELGRAEHYDALIVDEGQDLLLEDYLVVLGALVRGDVKKGTWRVFLDHKQDIFRGTAPPALRRLLDASPAQYRLSVNCRNTRPIAITNRLVSGIGSEETLKAEGPDVEQIWYRDDAHQRREVRKCLNRLLGEGIGPEDIVILSRYSLDKSALAGGLPQVPYPLQDGVDGGAAPVIRFSTVSSFKGLDSDVVLLVDVDDLASLAGLGQFYVGASRAKAYLAVFIAEAEKSHFEDRAREFGRSLRDAETE